jgi:hypothetical protein
MPVQTSVSSPAFHVLGAATTQNNVGSPATATSSITTTAKSDIFLLIASQYGPYTATYSSVTCGGSAMTQVSQIYLNNSTGNFALYRIAGMSAGTYTVSVTVSMPTFVFSILRTFAYTGIRTGVLTTQSAYGTAATESITTTMAMPKGSVVLGFSGNTNGNISTMSGGTNRFISTLSAGTNGTITLNDSPVNTTFSGAQSNYGSYPNWAFGAVVLS